MAEQYFVRVKGNVLGPYSRDQLVQLIKRRKVNRHHELSNDGRTWRQGSEYPDLFETASRPRVRRGESPPSAEFPLTSDELGPGADMEETFVLSLAEEDEEEPTWYYTHANQELGPVTWSQLKSLAATMALSPTDFVWNDSLTDWLEARAVEGLFTPAGDPIVIQAKQGESEGRTPGMAVASFVLGLSGATLFPFLGSIMAVVFGHMALWQMRRDPRLTGRGMAIAGLILGYIIIIAVVVGSIVCLFVFLMHERLSSAG